MSVASFGAKPVEIGDCEAAVLLCMGKRKGLTLGQIVALDEYVLANGPLAPMSDFDQLGGEASGDEVRAVYFATGVREGRLAGSLGNSLSKGMVTSSQSNGPQLISWIFFAYMSFRPMQLWQLSETLWVRVV